MLKGPRGFDDLLGPRQRLVLFDQSADKCPICRDRRRGVDVVVVGGPAECGTQIGQLEPEPAIGLALSRTVPQGKNVSLPPCEVAGMRVAGSLGTA